MRRLVSFIFLIFIGACFANASYENDTYGINFDIPDNWTLSERLNGRFIDLAHETKIASINISYFQFDEPVTANGLQIMRATSRYDGWMNLFERQGTAKENKSANVSESYVAVYSKHGLSNDGQLTLQEFIVGEYYYVSGNVGVVVSLSTEHNFWKIIQTNLRVLIDSFWLGTERDSWVSKDDPFKSDNEIWTHTGANEKNQNNFPLPFNWNDELNLVFETELGLNDTNHSKMPLFIEDTLITTVENRIYSLSLPSGNVNWSYELHGNIVNDLAYGNNVLTIVSSENVSSENVTSVMGVIPETGHVLFQRYVDDLIVDPVMVSENIVLITDTGLNYLNGVTGETKWKVNADYSPGFKPLFYEGQLITVKNASTIESRDDKNGKKLWNSKKFDSIVLQPVIVSDNIVFGISDNDTSFLVAIDKRKGDIKWKYQYESSSFIDKTLISGTDEFITVITKIVDSNALYLLSAQKVATGEVMWEKPFSTTALTRPLITTSFVMIQNSGGSLYGFDNLSGEDIDVIYSDDNKDITYYFLTSFGLVGLSTGESYKVMCYK
jgi:hypothetical protein